MLDLQLVWFIDTTKVEVGGSYYAYYMVYIHNLRVHRPLFRVGTTLGKLSKRSRDKSHVLWVRRGE